MKINDHDCLDHGKNEALLEKHRSMDASPQGGPWRRPPGDVLVRLRLEELRDACAATTRPLHGVGPSARIGALACLRASSELERATIYPAYSRLREALSSLLSSWEMTGLNLPDFTGALTTAQIVKATCKELVRGFEPRCSLRDAARTACAVWTSRHVAWNLLDQAWDEGADWYPSNPDWECCDDRIPISECYEDPAPFPCEIWDVAMGREVTDECLLLPLAYVIPDFSLTSRTPECALLALQGLGKYGDFHVAHLPVLPLFAWAASAGWPERLWERIDAYVERLAYRV